MTKKYRLFSIFFSIFFLLSPSSCSALNKDIQKKREQIQHAVEQDILGIYDIPFNTYVSLGMWDNIDSILTNTHKGIKVYKLPGMYYSRPYIVNNMIWVFDNADLKKRGVSVLTPELNLVQTSENKNFAKYEGGIRLISGNKIISGGSDQDVDSIVVWDIKDQKTKTLKLEQGHYTGSVTMGNEKIFAGSCGGKVNSWDINTMSHSGVYSASEQENINWDIFNSQPCISALRVHEDLLIGSGEKRFFIWDEKTLTLLRTYEKAFLSSIVYFFEDKMAEYKSNKIVIRNISDGQILNGVKTLRPVNDLIVTKENVLPNFNGELLIASLRHNKGLVFYDFNTMKLIKKTELKGESLCVYNKRIYATDDQFIYKYNLHHQVDQQYRDFLKTIKMEQIDLLSNDIYFQLLKRSHDYPDVIKKNTLGKSYLNQNNLDFQYSIKYGKLNQQQDQESIKSGINPKEIFGYKLIYEIKNLSKDDFLISILCEWHGEYGSDGVKAESKKSFYKQDLIIPAQNDLAHNNKIIESINIGQKEPVNLYIYPTNLEILPQGLFEEVTFALSKENQDISIIEKFLENPKLKKWHPELEKRKQGIIKAENDKSWLLKMIQ